MPQPEDLPPEYEEDETPVYNIFEEDRINEILDNLGISNDDDIELQLDKENLTNKSKKLFLSKKIEEAAKKRQQLPGYSTDITRKLKKGLSEAEAQYRRKIIQDSRKVLTDYIKFQQNRLENIKGSGLKRKTKRGGKIMFFNDPEEMLKKLKIILDQWLLEIIARN